MVPDLGEHRRVQAVRSGQALFGRHPAAQRDGHPPHGPRPQRHDPGRPRPLAPHARRRHALGPRHRPRRHRHAERRREGAPQGGQAPPGPRPRGLRRARLGVEEAVRRHDREAAPRPRLLLRLVARALHDGRGPLARRRRGLHGDVREGPRLPRQLHRELVPALRHRPRGRRDRARAQPRPPLVRALPRRRLRPRREGRGLPGLHHGRHDPPRDPPGRHGRRGKPQGRALPAPPRQDRDPPAHRARDPGPPRRLRRARVRHGHREDHACPRPERLPRRQAPRPRGDQHHERRRHDERARRRRLRRPRPLRVPREDRRRPRRRRLPRPRRGLRQPGRPLLPLPHRRRVPPLQAVVRPHEAPRREGDGGRARRPHRLHPEALREHLLQLDGEHPRLVHLAADLVGPPHPRLHLRVRPRMGRDREADGLPQVRRRRRQDHAGSRRPRHVVLLVALARSAGPTGPRTSRATTPRPTSAPRPTSSSSGSRA